MSREVWFYVNDDGELIRHMENDGYDYLRKGPQAHEAPMAIEDALRQYPGHHEEIEMELKKYAAKLARRCDEQQSDDIL